MEPAGRAPESRQPTAGSSLKSIAKLARRIRAERLTTPIRIRVDLRRSLRMHRKLALGAALAVFGIGALLLYVIFPGPALDPVSFTVSAAALVAVSAAFGAAAAIVAHNLDPRVYIGADVEHVLGVPAMEELPDFGEVPEEYTEVDMLRLANGIAHSCAKGSLQRCVFTGAGHGTGVTTLAARVKESLKTLERPAMLVDATAAAEAEQAESRATPRGSSHKAADESGSGCDELILTDTSPLADSPDTEYLARFADCVVVVAESGVTTRAQLRGTAECLRQLNVSKVKFVVNRVRQSQPGYASRQPLCMPGVPPAQFAEAIRRALAEPPSRIGGEPPSRFHSAKELETLNQRQSAGALAIVKHGSDSSAWQQPGVPSWLSDALVQLEAEAPQVVSTEDAAPGMPPDTAVPEDLSCSVPTELLQIEPPQIDPPQIDPPQIEPLPGERAWFEAHSIGNALYADEPEDRLPAMNTAAPAYEDDATPHLHEAALSLSESPREENASRLSQLRGIVSAADLRRICHPREEGTRELQASEVEFDSAAPVLARLSALRGLVSVDGSKEPSQADVPMPETGVAGEPLRGPAPAIAIAQASSATEKTARKPKPSRAKSTESARRKLRLDEDVQILPSKRGQYRRKNRDQATPAGRNKARTQQS